MDLHKSLTLAATIAVALGATAAPGPAGVNQRPRGIYQPAKPGILITSYTAVVAANAKLIRGIGATSASQDEGRGTYTVTFATDISSCAYVVTVGETDSSGTQPAALATVVGRSGDPTGIFIETFDHNGSLKNLPFHVDVGC